MLSVGVILGVKLTKICFETDISANITAFRETTLLLSGNRQTKNSNKSLIEIGVEESIDDVTLV